MFLVGGESATVSVVTDRCYFCILCVRKRYDIDAALLERFRVYAANHGRGAHAELPWRHYVKFRRMYNGKGGLKAVATPKERKKRKNCKDAYAGPYACYSSTEARKLLKLAANRAEDENLKAHSRQKWHVRGCCVLIEVFMNTILHRQ